LGIIGKLACLEQSALHNYLCLEFTLRRKKAGAFDFGKYFDLSPSFKNKIGIGLKEKLERFERASFFLSQNTLAYYAKG
jgi:hypothetical protein